ncbi:MAG: prephenate dehydrogenase/arogenate dehydrogenase family protein [Candidatus Omnitrophota bacterium]
MRLFNKIAIVGTGLIGGSIALAIKKNRLADKVIGVSRHKESLLLAKRKGAIDIGSCDLGIIKDAQLVILAMPVDAIIKLAPKISAIVSKDCIVTDVGSTKEDIVSRLKGVFTNYVGSHPLAGSEKRGIANARPDLFKNSLCILTPARDTNNKALKKLQVLWGRLGAKTALLSPSGHDKALSFVSHLPHVVAFSLIGIMPKQYLRFASTGLKDTTRIAASESELWAAILLSNRKNIIQAMELLRVNMSRIKSALQKKDLDLLTLIVKQAKAKRELLG